MAHPRSASRSENHATHDEILERRHVVEQREACTTRVRERREVVRKNSDERIRESNAAGAIEPSPCGMRLRQCRVGSTASLHLCSELPCIPQSEIESLTRDGMQRLRSVSDENGAPARHALRNAQRQMLRCT